MAFLEALDGALHFGYKQVKARYGLMRKADEDSNEVPLKEQIWKRLNMKKIKSSLSRLYEVMQSLHSLEGISMDGSTQRCRRH